MQINLIFTRKVLHLASFFKLRVLGTQKQPILIANWPIPELYTVCILLM